MKVAEIRKLSEQELKVKMEEARENHLKLRFQQSTADSSQTIPSCRSLVRRSHDSRLSFASGRSLPRLKGVKHE